MRSKTTTTRKEYEDAKKIVLDTYKRAKVIVDSYEAEDGLNQTPQYA